MKIALAQIDTTVGDFAGNVDRIVRFAHAAEKRRADLVVFPELALCGYPPRDLVEKPAFVRRSEQELQRLAGLLPPQLPAVVGYVRSSRAGEGKPVSDAAALLRDGRVALDYAKILLPFYDVFDESRYFEPGDKTALFDVTQTRVAMTICEDIWNDKNFWKKRLYSRDPAAEAVAEGAQVILNIASSPFHAEKIAMRHQMLQTFAREHRVAVVYVNHVGGNDQLVFDGSSMAFNAQGELCARAKSFEEDLVLFDTANGETEIRPGPESEIAAIYQALVLGTRDYVAKCGFTKVLVGLSGGIDSSLVATIAADAVGPDNVLGVGMPGPYSSSGSLRDAETLARNLKTDLRVIPITGTFESYLETLDAAFEGRPRDVTEENIQARIRGNILMALSNKMGALVLSTGNKSELAAGYCTLYGDMAGGLAVIADVPKTVVYQLARYVNRAGERIPPACLTKAPSAELRLDQTDQDTLPPYEVLDIILKAYIEDKLSTKDIIEKFQLDSGLVQDTLRRVNGAEYKRQQAAPALKVTAKAFGMGRRFPIAQKFFE
jgi:NAD+ synthase (glutamine-hydrolysing)